MFFMFFYLQSNVFNIYVLTNEVDEDDDEYTSLQIYYWVCQWTEWILKTGHILKMWQKLSGLLFGAPRTSVHRCTVVTVQPVAHAQQSAVTSS